jgi:arginine deiminase
VIVHRPGLELARLTRKTSTSCCSMASCGPRKAKEEHDVFAEALRDKGVRVHYFGQLLAETLEVPEGRAFVLDRVCTRDALAPALVEPVRALFEDLDGAALAEHLVGGVLKADLHPLRTSSLRWETLRADDFVLTPLPNHLFPRDNSCWVYGGVSANSMAKPARNRESIHMLAVYGYHPLFAREDFVTYARNDADYLPPSIEAATCMCSARARC